MKLGEENSSGINKCCAAVTEGGPLVLRGAQALFPPTPTLINSEDSSQSVSHAAAHQPLDVGDGSSVVQLSSPVNERGQPGRVQRRLGVLPPVRPPTTHPRVLQTGSSARPLPGILLQHRGHKIPGRLAHVPEVFVREAEVQAADVDARFFWRFIQKRGNAAEHHVDQHTHAPHISRNRDGRPSDELRGGKLGVSEQEVHVPAVGRKLDGVAEVDELNGRRRSSEVQHDVLRLPQREIRFRHRRSNGN